MLSKYDSLACNFVIQGFSSLWEMALVVGVTFDRCHKSHPLRYSSGDKLMCFCSDFVNLVLQTDLKCNSVYIYRVAQKNVYTLYSSISLE